MKRFTVLAHLHYAEDPSVGIDRHVGDARLYGMAYQKAYDYWRAKGFTGEVLDCITIVDNQTGRRTRVGVDDV